jgi:general secretion pathway protein N
MRHPARWALVGTLLGATLATVLWLPARWLQPWVSQASQGRVEWVQTQGTLWDGQTRIALTGGPGSQDRALVPGTWSWQLRPNWRGGPGAVLRVVASCCLAQPVQVVAHWQNQSTTWRVSDAQWHAPLTPLRGLGTPWNTLGLQGQLQLQTLGLAGTLKGGRSVVQGQVQVSASDVSSRLTTVAPLGSYSAELSWPQQALAQWSVRTLSGHLDIHGQGQIAQGRVRFRGEASASAETETALANLLNIIGRRQGRVTLLTLG